MKISASVLAQNSLPVGDLAMELERLGVDFLHVDCKDAPAVFEQIQAIRAVCQLPIDLHLITERPAFYEPFLAQNPPEMVAFQFENLPDGKLDIQLPAESRLGVALQTDTPIESFEPFAEKADFVLLMTTTPGESGGRFDKRNFQKIRSFRKRFPTKAIHVDGGVNNEVSFILRTLGAQAIVSGSYLVNSPAMGQSLKELKRNWVDSAFVAEDFMAPLEDTPYISTQDITLTQLLLAVETGNLGFAALTDETGKLTGMTANADIRRGLLRNLHRLDDLRIEDFINHKPFFAKTTDSVSQILQAMRNLSFPVLYLPVVDEAGVLAGSLTFNHLIQNEL